MQINKQVIYPQLIFNKEIVYDEHITIYPVRMKDIIEFQQCTSAITVRKDATFQDKEIIRMSYLDFIKYACRNKELADKYDMEFLPFYYDYVLRLLSIVCGDAQITYNTTTLEIKINDEALTPEVFDDIRRIIILQNDISFDIDEFMNIDTVNALEKAREFEAKKNKEKSDIEDYIDSLIVELKVTEEYVSNMTVRKFWRYIKRINKHDDYQSCRTAEMGGMVTFKEPLTHWMTTLDVEDKDSSLKVDEQDLRSKIG